MSRRIKKKILSAILDPIAKTENKLQDKADYIFGCLIKNKLVSDEDKPCFIREFFRHISQISDDMSSALDKAVMKTLEKLNISIEEEGEEDQRTKNP